MANKFLLGTIKGTRESLKVTRKWASQCVGLSTNAVKWYKHLWLTNFTHCHVLEIFTNKISQSSVYINNNICC